MGQQDETVEQTGYGTVYGVDLRKGILGLSGEEWTDIKRMPLFSSEEGKEGDKKSSSMLLKLSF